ncbi:hypothetical protein LEM8419_02186 [Neolewinella maritima]|uniref:Uncharacterized protein n=1 Tax=Neolewinella maritima TaxID=1383882 RepID=A0ABN8F9Q3_9BACT|nr:hypothetical protein [Neolewinella maritima]CAH1001285.1 hypothetical protein LEM8419_02186 [Neolewinella maritima]
MSPEFLFLLNIVFSILAVVGVVVFAIALLRNLGNIAEQIAALRSGLASTIQSGSSADAAPGIESLRLQACERFTLMLERISIPNLLLRIPPGEDSAPREYTAELLLAIRQEVEYNITQQIYVSDSLWRIVTQSRDNISMLIARAAEGAESSRQIAERLRRMSAQQQEDPVALAQGAIRREAASVLTN